PCGPSCSTRASTMTAPRRAIRCASQNGTRPPWRGRSALPVRVPIRPFSMRSRPRSGNLAPMPRMQVEGGELHYEDTGGPGIPIVFAHGLLWSGAMYRFQIEALRGDHRCISFDFRGQGRSPIADSGYDMDTLAHDAAGLIEKLRAAPCHFVG